MQSVYINGKPTRLDPRKALGKGGEADVYRYGKRQALKIWKGAEHPDLQGLPDEQAAAQQRLELYQRKMPAFPRSLPERVVAPNQWATDASGNCLVGYTMPLIADAEPLYRYTDRAFRAQGISQETVQRILLDLHTSVCALHHLGIVIGDFNDLNVLVRDTCAHLIDADSFQFGIFACPVFTPRFLDPLLCNQQAAAPVLSQPYTQASDWYAFTVMVMQVLLNVGPYGGLYRPNDSAQRIPQAARPLHRITVFRSEVRYPRPAIPYQVLPDDLLHHLQTVFEQDQRGVFPRVLLERLHWTRCPICGLEHGRTHCPVCTHPLPVPQVPGHIVRGSLTVTSIFKTQGQIVCAAAHHGRLAWLSFEDSHFRREAGEVVLAGGLSPQLSFALAGETTLIASQGQIVGLRKGHSRQPVSVDHCGTVPAFAVNTHHTYRVDGGQLVRDCPLGPEYIGAVLAGQTRIWVGETFGFGLYRAGELSVAFVFDAQRSGINDTVPLPVLRGELLEAGCVFTDARCWFFTATQEQGRIVNRCVVIERAGSVAATTSAEADEGGWLATLRGKCAVDSGLFACTDEGLVRLDIVQGYIVESARFPDTAPFMTRDSDLLLYQDGFAVVSRQEIYLLQGYDSPGTMR